MISLPLAHSMHQVELDFAVTGLLKKALMIDNQTKSFGCTLLFVAGASGK